MFVVAGVQLAFLDASGAEMRLPSPPIAPIPIAHVDKPVLHYQNR